MLDGLTLVVAMSQYKSTTSILSTTKLEQILDDNGTVHASIGVNHLSICLSENQRAVYLPQHRLSNAWVSVAAQYTAGWIWVHIPRTIALQEKLLALS